MSISATKRDAFIKIKLLILEIVKEDTWYFKSFGTCMLCFLKVAISTNSCQRFSSVLRILRFANHKIGRFARFGRISNPNLNICMHRIRISNPNLQCSGETRISNLESEFKYFQTPNPNLESESKKWPESCRIEI